MKRYGMLLLGLTAICVLLAYSLNKPDELTLSAVGDILLDRDVRIAMGSDYAYPYEEVVEDLREADLLIGNLECPLTTKENPVLKDPVIIFKADTQNAAALKEAGFDILNLANNHTMDYDATGLRETVAVLREEGLLYTGASLPRSEGQVPLIVEKNGCRIGFLGYSVFPPEGYISQEGKADVSRYYEEQTAIEIENVRQSCDLLVVSFHWGKEFDYYPSERQKDIAHQAVDAGADLILGHHPHVLQEMEEYGGAYILYSLGNFIFDKQIPRGTDESMIAKITVRDKKIVEVDTIPLCIENCRPTRINGSFDEEEYLAAYSDTCSE
jgi:poly-gamma-glutamate synthesis protein (capsule biosynthesis protein)